MQEIGLFDDEDLKLEPIYEDYINHGYIEFMKKHGKEIERQNELHKEWVKLLPPDFAENGLLYD